MRPEVGVAEGEETELSWREWRKQPWRPIFEADNERSTHVTAISAARTGPNDAAALPLLSFFLHPA